MIRVRIDDFPQTKGEPQHTLTAFREFHRILSEGINRKRYLLGVIPARCKPEDLLCIRNETNAVVGMHGITHDEYMLDLFQNEFPPYLTHQGIIDRLVEAHDALSAAIDQSVRIYMPPRNHIDRKTVDALSAAGFDWFTTGPETHPDILSRYRNFIHSERQHEYGRTDEMWNRGDDKRLIEDAGSRDLVLTLHWTWEANIGFQHLDKFLASIPKDLWRDFDA